MKWLLQNVRRRARFAIHNPRWALSAMVRKFTLADEGFLAHLTDSSPCQIWADLDKPVNTPAFAAHLGAEEQHFHSLSIDSANLFAKKILNQYAAVRAIAPDCIVETGVANSVSSSYLLLALQKNERGRLHSIGLADTAFLPRGQDSRWFVPHWLRAAWKVHLGDAREILTRLLRQLGKIGIFIDNSLHTYGHMMREFETAYRHLVSVGILIWEGRCLMEQLILRFCTHCGDARSADPARRWLPPEELGARLNRQSSGLAESVIGCRRQ